MIARLTRLAAAALLTASLIGCAAEPAPEPKKQEDYAVVLAVAPIEICRVETASKLACTRPTSFTIRPLYRLLPVKRIRSVPKAPALMTRSVGFATV